MRTRWIVFFGVVISWWCGCRLAATTIQLSDQRRRLVVGKHEIVASIGVARNLTTQKQAVFRVRLLDKFDRELYRRDYDIPIGPFSDGVYSNKARVATVSGRTGFGVVIATEQGAPYTAMRTLDLVGIRAARSTVIRGGDFVVTPILTHFQNQFVWGAQGDNTVRLSGDDEWVARVWTGSFSIDVPIRIDWYGGVHLGKPVGDYRVHVPQFQPKMARIVVYRHPSRRSPSALIQVTPTASIQFLGAHGEPVLRSDRVVVQHPAIKVEVNGRSGWILDDAGLAALGLRVPDRGE